MRLLKLAILLLLWPYFFVAVGLVRLAVSLLGLEGRWKIISRLTQCFARLLTSVLKIHISVEGDRSRLESGGCFIVSNHLGYIDGFVLGSLFPVIYVSKKEVRHWPLIGQWTALCGTIYVDRQRKDKIPRLVEEIAKKLRGRTNVLNFPEGTSTNGERLLPFQSAPFAGPLRARAKIVPVTLTYKAIDHEPLSFLNRDRIYWYGDMDFVTHFWTLLSRSLIEVTVKIHPEIDTSRYENNSLGRKRLSQDCYDYVSGKAERTVRRRVLP